MYWIRTWRAAIIEPKARAAGLVWEVEAGVGGGFEVGVDVDVGGGFGVDVDVGGGLEVEVGVDEVGATVGVPEGAAPQATARTDGSNESKTDRFIATCR